MRLSGEDSNLGKQIECLCAAADAAGAAVMDFFKTSQLEIASKSDGSPVTPADRAGEQAAMQVIGRYFPQDEVEGEEFGLRSQTRIAAHPPRWRWLIDPIDGTKSFMMGNPLFGTLIGLLDNGQPVLGAAWMPALGECYYGDGRQSYQRAVGAPRLLSPDAAMSGAHFLSDARLAATHPDMFAPRNAARFQHLAQQCGFCRFGGDCYNYLLLALGFIDVVAEDSLKIYDILPLVPILTGAGCVVSDWQGHELKDGNSSQSLAARNPALHVQALNALASA